MPCRLSPSQRWLGFAWPAIVYLLYAATRVPLIWSDHEIGANVWPGHTFWGITYFFSAVLTLMALIFPWHTIWFGLAMGAGVALAGLRAIVVHFDIGVDAILGTTNLMLISALLTWAGYQQLHMRRSARTRYME